MCDGKGYARALFRVASHPSVTAAGKYVGIAATTDGLGYWLVRADGRVSAFGDAAWSGSVAPGQAQSAAPVVGMARSYDGKGYWLVDAGGHVYGFGDARPYGSLPQLPGAAAARRDPIAGIAATPDGRGYWLVSAFGHVYSFGDARADGMPTYHLAPFDAIATRPAGGYLVAAASNAATYEYPGGILAGGGSGTALGASVVGMAATPSGNGAFLAAADGSVIPIGDAAGDLPACAVACPSVPGNHQVVTAPATGIADTPNGQGYWLVGADGNVYNFGNAPFVGSGYR